MTGGDGQSWDNITLSALGSLIYQVLIYMNSCLDNLKLPPRRLGAAFCFFRVYRCRGGTVEKLRQTPASATIRRKTSVRDSECNVLAKWNLRHGQYT